MSCYTRTEGFDNRDDYFDDVCSRLVGHIEQTFGYVFRQKTSQKTSDTHNAQSSGDETDTETATEDQDRNRSESSKYFMRLYRCSQDKSSANYSNYTSTVSPRKRRRRTVQDRYSCYGRIRIIVPKTDSGPTTVHIRALEPLELQHNQILIQFSHNCHHPSRERKPIPKSIREFIKNPAHVSRTAAEMFRKILNAVALGRLQNIDMNDVTDDNVRYWWSQIRKKEYERDKDPWVSAVMYLREQSDVTVYSFIDERRRYFCWYYPRIFDVDLTTVTEVYIDSTHGTNGQNAELFGIIACENGYGVPIGYMLMEKKPNEDSRLFPGEVIEACTRFFYHAKELGLNPIIIHTDKSAAEIAAIKVSISVLQTDDRLMLAGPTQRLAFAHGMWKRIFENG